MTELADPNFGFNGPVPDGASIAENIRLGLEYQSTHTPCETALWFYNHVRTGGIWDYKTKDGSQYAQFGNYHYGALGRALGYSDFTLKFAAGVYQQKENGEYLVVAFANALASGEKGNWGDNADDPPVIQAGIDAARDFGYTSNFSGGIPGLIEGGLALYTPGLLSLLAAMSNGAMALGNEDFGDIPLATPCHPTPPPPPPAPKGAKDILPNSALANYSPIILDLDGDGVETLGVNSGVQYDLDNNGFQETVGWAGADDGLLALDRNGDGSITGGLELFGNHTTLADGNKAANGFVALAELDENSDGRIDENDAVYADLRVWRDVNANGVSEAGELLTLAEAGVSQLNLANTYSTTIDAEGNAHRQIGSYFEATCFKLAA